MTLPRIRYTHSGTFSAVLGQLGKLDMSVKTEQTEETEGPTASNDIKPIRDIHATDFPVNAPIEEEPLNPTVAEEELTAAIEELLEAQNIWGSQKDLSRVSLNDESLTPAQRFYLENRQLLLKRAVDYSVQKARDESERAIQEMEDEWAFYRDPVVRPRRGHLWDVASENSEDNERENPVEFERGRFPEIDGIVHLLQNEKVDNIKTLDLELCNRRDIGEWAIVGTVQSAEHGIRVGNLARRSINRLDLEHVRCFINSIPGQEWVVARLGPVIVHLMTPNDRDKYKLEEMYASSEPLSAEWDPVLLEEIDQSFINK